MEDAFITTLKEIKGQYCIAFSINNKYLFIARRGNADPFYIAKNKEGNEFLCSSNINSFDKKNLFRIITPWGGIKFTAGKLDYEKIELK